MREPGIPEIVFGVSVTHPGVFTVDAFTLTYHVGARRYRATWAQALAICAPASAYAGTCSAPSVH
jgi:hypothetical protein